jgi:hypothetical protein
MNWHELSPKCQEMLASQNQEKSRIHGPTFARPHGRRRTSAQNWWGKKKKKPFSPGGIPLVQCGPRPRWTPPKSRSCTDPRLLLPTAHLPHRARKKLGCPAAEWSDPTPQARAGSPLPTRARPLYGPRQAHCSDRAGKDLSLISGPAPVSLGSIRTHLQATDLTLQGLRLPNVYSTERCLAVSGPRLGWVSQPTTRARLLAAMATDPAPCRH